MTVTLLRGDARALSLADASVDLVVTSPPYWALRSYQDGGEHYDGQIGAEPTPDAYVDSLIECTAEWMRVLKPSGSIWVNLGDSYAGQAPGRQGATGQRAARSSANEPFAARRARTDAAPAKSLRLLPERYRIACVDQLGLIARAVVIWDKPNGLPESVTDRVRRSHEDWVHLVKQPRYFSGVDSIREPAVRTDARASGKRYSGYIPGIGRKHQGLSDQANHPLGSLPGSVREVATQPLKVPPELGVDHFAAFPMDWPRWIIQGWSPSGICTACGEGRRPVAARGVLVETRGEPHGTDPIQRHGRNGSTLGQVNTRHITGEACACPEPTASTRPAVVLDPFGGTGTSALVAHALGRHGISVDMSADYCRLAAWRTSDPGQLAAAMQVEKPPAQRAGQLDLFGASP